MKAELPKPVHESYQRHRRQVTSQIILPIALVAILFLVVVGLLVATMIRGTGDVSRWAAVSTIWIVIPVIIASLVFLVLLLGIIYLLWRLLEITPIYTNKAQNFIQKLGIRIRLAADVTVKPVIFLDGIGASIQRLIGRK